MINLVPTDTREPGQDPGGQAEEGGGLAAGPRRLQRDEAARSGAGGEAARGVLEKRASDFHEGGSDGGSKGSRGV